MAIIKRILKSVLGILLTILFAIISLQLYLICMVLGLAGMMLVMGAPLAVMFWGGDFMVDYLRGCGWGELWVALVAFITVGPAAIVAFFLACVVAFIPVSIANDGVNYFGKKWGI